jgi:hypothetical protein
MKFYIFLLCLALTTGGCATAPHHVTADEVISGKEVPQNAEYIGQISIAVGNLDEGTLWRAERRLEARAARKGGNFLIIDDQYEEFSRPSGMISALIFATVYYAPQF